MDLEISASFPNRKNQRFPLTQKTMIIGSLPSNQIVLQAPNVDPIHALLEFTSGHWVLTDLGSTDGVRVNGKAIAIEARIQLDEEFSIGAVKLSLVKVVELQPPPPPPAPSMIPKKAQESVGSIERRSDAKTLFDPRRSEAGGTVLEVIAYWQGTVLEVGHFVSGTTGKNTVSIGEGVGADFPVACENVLERHAVAELNDTGYTLNLLEGMSARLRKMGQVEAVGPGRHQLKMRDIAHVTFGPIKYFFVFKQPPEVVLPPAGIQDRLYFSLSLIGLTIFAILSLVLSVMEPTKLKIDQEEIWAVVSLPEPEKKREKPEVKPEVKVVETPPPVSEVPPKKEEPPVKPVEPTEVAKAVPAKKEAPKEAPKALDNLAPKPKAPAAPIAAAQPKPTPPAGTKAPGGERKGTTASNVKGVEGVNNQKPSGANLSKLGLGVGKISSASGAGAMHTEFKDSAGGAGGGAGSAAKSSGQMGLGDTKTLGLGGGASAAANFGGGGAIGNSDSFSGARQGAGVNLSGGDPLISGGISEQAINAVIRANEYQIRSCYQQALTSSPNAQGSVDVRFVIGSNGQVTAAGVKSSDIPGEAFKSCVTNSIKRWKFPQPIGGTPASVNKRFDLKPV